MRLGLRSCTPLPRVVSRGGRLVKATQLGLFGSSTLVGKPREKVKAPGSHGGKFYTTDKGEVRYGEKRRHTGARPSGATGDGYRVVAAETRSTTDALGVGYRRRFYVELGGKPFAGPFESRAEAVAHQRDLSAKSRNTGGGAGKPGERSAAPDLGEHTARKPFQLDPPELGRTRSGKAIPHPDDPRAQDPDKMASIENWMRLRADVTRRGGTPAYQITGDRKSTPKDAQAWIDRAVADIKRRSGTGTPYSAEHGPHFRDWTREDHLDAGKVHEIYRRHHEKALHHDDEERHASLRDHHNALASMPESYFRR